MDERTKKSLSHSVKDASWWSIQLGFGESFFSALGVFLQATTFQLGLLGAVPQLISSLLQLVAVRLTHYFSRKSIVIVNAFAQASVWLFMIGMLWFFPNIWMFIGLVVIYFTFGALAGPAWFSWIGDLVPQRQRGTYFGRRNKISGFVGFVSVLLAGLLLEGIENRFTAFSLLFTLAFMGRFVSSMYLCLQWEPKAVLRDPKPLRFSKFLKGAFKTQVGTFTLFISFMNAAFFLTGPLFAWYWLSDLHFSYLQFSILVAVGSIATFITMTTWGRAGDSYGNKVLLAASSYGLCCIPLLWIVIYFLPFPFVFAVMVQIFAGLVSAGFNLSSSNFLYDAIEPHQRVRLLAYHNVVKGILIFVGGMVGGFIAQFTFFVPSMIVVLMISMFLRMAVTLLFLEKIKEARIVNQRPHFFYLLSWMHVQGVMIESVVGLNRTVRIVRKLIR